MVPVSNRAIICHTAKWIPEIVGLSLSVQSLGPNPSEELNRKDSDDPLNNHHRDMSGYNKPGDISERLAGGCQRQGNEQSGQEN